MATALAMPAIAIDGQEDVFGDGDIMEEGNWTEERREILDKLSDKDIIDELLKLQKEYADTLTVKAYI